MHKHVALNVCRTADTESSRLFWLHPFQWRGWAFTALGLMANRGSYRFSLWKTVNLKYCFWLWNGLDKVIFFCDWFTEDKYQASSTYRCLFFSWSLLLHSCCWQSWKALMWGYSGVWWAKDLTRCHNVKSKSI